MRIYDYYTFLKQKENVTKIKLKDWANVSNKGIYNETYIYWGKKVEVTYTYKKEYENNYYIINEGAILTIPSYFSFYDKIEYVEVVNELEVE